MTIAVLAPLSQPQSVLPSVSSLSDSSQNSVLLREPPTANRGVIPQDPRRELIPTIDYVTCVFQATTLERLIEIQAEIEAIAGVAWVDCPGRGRTVGTWYTDHMKTEDGSLLCYRINETNPEYLDFVIQLSGTACRRAGTSAIAGFVRHVYAEGGKLSRIDVNVDDFQGDLNYEEVMKASYESRYTRFRKSFRFDGCKVDSQKEGFTVSFGERSSDRYVRIYDAKAKHGIPAIRYEVEFKGATANAIGKMITTVTTDEMLSQLLGGILNGTLRITESARGHNTNRIASSPFWQRFSDRLSNSIRVASPKREVTIQNTIQYVKNIVAKPLAKFIAYYGCHWADELKSVIKEGRARFNRDDFAALKGCTTDGFLRFWDDLGYTVDVPAIPDWARDWMRFDEFDLKSSPF